MGIAIAVGVLLLLTAAGTALLARSCGIARWKLGFIPIYSFSLLGKITGVFTVFNIPMRKFGLFFAELVAVAAVAWAISVWGQHALPSPSRESLVQIMYLPLAACAFLGYAAIVRASQKVFRRFRAEPYRLFVLLSLLAVPVPFLYALLSRRAPLAAENLY